MNILKLSLLWLAFTLSNTVAAIPIKAEHLFANPNNEMVQLSPNAAFISLHHIKEKTHYIDFFNAKSFARITSLSIGNDNVLNDYYWLNNQQLLIDITNAGKQSYVVLELVNQKVSNKRIKTDGYLVHILPEQPDKVMFAKKKSARNNTHELYVISIESLVLGDFDEAFEVDHNKSDTAFYAFDDHFQRVITAEYDEENQSIEISYVPLDGGDWQTIISLQDTDYKLEPMGFINADSLAVITNKNSDKLVLRSFNINTQTLGNIIYQHPKYDLLSAGFTEQGELDFVTFKQHGLTQKLFFDKGQAHFRKRLAKSFPNQEIYIIDHVVDKKMVLLYANGSNEPGQYYIIDQQADKAYSFVPSYTKLIEQKFYASQQLQITAEDGTELEAFLTLPAELDHSTLLVMPHGGPIDVQESDRFNKSIQYFASRGFAVLRVNFRGSSGFGKKFLEQGVGEFGKQIEQDISAAVAKVKQQHQFKYQCAIGASYGGYSSTMLAIKHPDEYDCVIASFGIYDLPLLFNASNYRSGEEYKKIIEKTVGKFDQSLSLVSPVYLAKALKAPILLIAGRDDDIADFEHTNRFKYVLNKYNHPIETMFYKKTGHGHESWGGDMHEAAISYDYLMRTLHLTPPPPEALDEAAQIALADDYTNIADGFYFNNIVKNDYVKAFNYYKKAASYNHPRANFNIGSYYHRGDQVAVDVNKAISYYQTAAKLEYPRAYARLGRMYMEGEYLPQNWQLALDNLLKAQKLDDSSFNNIVLARLYCTAPKAYQEIDKCLELMDLAQYKKISKSRYKTAKKQIKATLAWTFSSAQLSAEQLDKLQKFAVDAFELTTTKVTLENIRVGQFNYVESEVFGKDGEYVLQPSTAVLSSNTEGARFGVIFETDVPGADSKLDKVAITSQWIETTAEGKKEYPKTTLLIGSPIADWRDLRSFTYVEQASTWTLKLYDFDQKLLFKKDFKVAPSPN